MHEGAILQAVLITILDTLENTPGAQVARVQLELGASGHFTEEAVRQYFQLFAQHTPVEGATLELVWRPAIYQCLCCSQRFESISSPAICPHCGDVGLEIIHQDSCAIRHLDLLIPDKNVAKERTEEKNDIFI